MDSTGLYTRKRRGLATFVPPSTIRHSSSPGTLSAINSFTTKGAQTGERRHKHQTFVNMSAVPLDGMPTEDALTTDWRRYRAHLIGAHRTSQAPFSHDTFKLGMSDTTGNPSSKVRHGTHADDVFWVHPLHNVEVGACLVASPHHKWPDAFAHLRNAVILLTQLSSTKVSGIILNRPTKYEVGTHSSALARAGKEFARNPIMLGGDCSTGSLEIVHPYPPAVCMGAQEIMPGLSRGGFNAARKLVSEGVASNEDFHFYVAYSKWTEESFRAEMDHGAWDVVACSPNILLSDQIRRPRDWLWKSLRAVC